LGYACDRVDKGTGADAYLADYDDVEDVLGVGTRESGRYEDDGWEEAKNGRELTLSLRASSWAIVFKRSLMRDAFGSLRRKAGRKRMPTDC
jgi:hypothetical protein